MPTITSGSPTPVDGRRLRGDATRQLVLAEAVQMASEKGLSDMSIAQLADAVHLSKSGIATLFGSKEALQLAVVEYARTVFVAEVITPCSEVPDGAEKLRAIGASWLRYSRNRVFRGGCFFLAAAAEFDSRPGAVKQRVAQCLGSGTTIWRGVRREL
ncbi:TetR/AcrR family transcriptional regulator [Leucobacter coleopterorum]|uniref:TetR/AcrR family transcriptional regulator n=1 Tax=Leucobacter coleopterorum TaxID=2714933 RepID=A0ABX6JXS3_9MICO|nr:TetR/AcrR family transcriptional regulator [Leucobacter coleopterorum]QIM19119.1 TetR/AcrR family transcriptional regulator [Leucobacter coleopterorum]